VNVAKDLGVKQYIMVTSLGTGKIGFPASRCHRFCPIQQAVAVTLRHYRCKCIVRSCRLISCVYPYVCCMASSSHVSSSGHQDLSVSKGSHRKMAVQGRTLHEQALQKLRAHMLGLEAGSSNATSVPFMIVGISLYDVCREVYVRTNMVTWSMLFLTYTSLQTS